jgi:metal-dependent amidase/aminoacylase/carboxypeptidase family protein
VALGLFAPAICLAQKPALDDSIRKREEQSWTAALQIWKWAEPGYHETKSSALLAGMLEEAGFKVERLAFAAPGTADVENLFATIGSGPPHLVLSCLARRAR